MPPCLGGKSFVTNNDGTARPYAGAGARVIDRVRNTARPPSAQMAPVANAPRSPVKCTTIPHTNAPSPCDKSKNEDDKLNFTSWGFRDKRWQTGHDRPDHERQGEQSLVAGSGR